MLEAILSNLDTLGAVLILALLVLVVTPGIDKRRAENRLEEKKLVIAARATEQHEEREAFYKVVQLCLTARAKDLPERLHEEISSRR